MMRRLRLLATSALAASLSFPLQTPAQDIRTTSVGGVSGNGNITTGTGAPTSNTAAAGAVYSQSDAAVLWDTFGTVAAPTLVQQKNAHATYSATMTSTPTSGNLLVAVCVSSTALPAANTGWTSEGSGGYLSAPLSEIRVVGRIVSGDTTAETPCTGSGPAGVSIYEINGSGATLAADFQNVTITGVYRGSSNEAVATTLTNTFAIGGGMVGGNANGCPITLTGTVAPATLTDATCTPGLTSGTATVATSGTNTTSNAAGAGGTGSWSTAGFLVLISPNGSALTLGWQKHSQLTVIKNNGSNVSTAPRTMNFQQALVATDDGAGNETISVAASGSPPTNTGACAINTQVGGNTIGTFKANGACTSSTVILGFAYTAAHGWVCNTRDRTTVADSMNETADSTTSATLTGTMVTADVMQFDCWPY